MYTSTIEMNPNQMAKYAHKAEESIKQRGDLDFILTLYTLDDV